MKIVLVLIILFASLISMAQEEELLLQGKIIDAYNIPVSDAYIFNTRSLKSAVSRYNGVFDIALLPRDSVIITHISFLRKEVSAFQLMVNPVVQLAFDTINIKPVNISGNKFTEYERAMKNMDMIEFDFRTLPGDNFSESEQMEQLMKTNFKVQQVEASSLRLYSFSPSEILSKWAERRKKKKEARQYGSTKEIPDDTEEK